MLGIIGAMDLEVDALRQEIRGGSEKKGGFSRYYTGLLWGVPVSRTRSSGLIWRRRQKS